MINNYQIIGNHDDWESLSCLQTAARLALNNVKLLKGFLFLNGEFWGLGNVVSGQWDYSVSPSQVGLRTFGLRLDMNNTRPSLLATNICDIIMSSFVIGQPTSDAIFSMMPQHNPGLLGVKLKLVTWGFQNWFYMSQ